MNYLLINTANEEMNSLYLKLMKDESDIEGKLIIRAIIESLSYQFDNSIQTMYKVLQLLEKECFL